MIHNPICVSLVGNIVHTVQPAHYHCKEIGLKSPQRPKSARRTEIIEAARKVLRRDGFSDFTLAKVANEVQLSRPNFYRFFDDKAALLSAVLAYETALINSRRLDEVSKLRSFERQIVRSLELVVEIIHGDDLMSIFLEPGNVPYTAYTASSDPDILKLHRDYWIPILESARKRGELREGLDRDKIIRWLLGLQLLFLERREIFPTSKDIAEYTKLFVMPSLANKSKKT